MSKANNRALALAIFAMLFAPAASARAEEHCAMTDGFIDNSVFEAANSGGEDDKGIGGTGVSHDGSKISATHAVFILGTVYDFGSICVNGMRVQYDSKTPVEIDGTEASAEKLKIGQVVEVLAEADTAARTLHAKSVHIENALTGPVTRIDTANHKAYVMDEPVSVGSTDILSRLREGDRISVSGLRDNDGTVHATYIGRAAYDHDMVYGTVSATANTFKVGHTRIAATSGLLELEPGEVTTIEGMWKNGMLQPTKAGEDEEEDEDYQYASYEGYISPLHADPKSAKICSEDFDISGLDRSSLKTGERVIVNAVKIKDGKMKAISIRPSAPPQLQRKTK